MIIRLLSSIEFPISSVGDSIYKMNPFHIKHSNHRERNWVIYSEINESIR